MQAGEGCRYTGGEPSRANVVLSVVQVGVICREGGLPKQPGITLRLCTFGFERDEAFGSDIAVRKNADGSWTFYESVLSASRARATPTPTAMPADAATPTPSPTPLPTPTPKSPANVRYALDGSTIRVSWDAVDGADSYKVYHDDFSDDLCRLGRDGSPAFCEELAADVTGTTYVHTSPDAGENYYWVGACNSGGCSEIDSENPATPLVAKPSQPANVRYALDGSTIRVSWDAVDGADSYKVYHDDFFDSSCWLGGDGSLAFCEELAADVTGTSYVHASPDRDKNYYWVVACNRGGCSEIDSENPARQVRAEST